MLETKAGGKWIALTINEMSGDIRLLITWQLTKYINKGIVY